MESLNILNSSGTAHRIRVLLADRNMTQSSLATALGLSRSALSQRIRGNTQFKADEIVEIAKLFSVTPNDLLIPNSRDMKNA